MSSPARCVPVSGELFHATPRSRRVAGRASVARAPGGRPRARRRRNRLQLRPRPAPRAGPGRRRAAASRTSADRIGRAGSVRARRRSPRRLLRVRTQLWDLAAGGLIAEEAGCVLRGEATSAGSGLRPAARGNVLRAARRARRGLSLRLSRSTTGDGRDGDGEGSAVRDNLDAPCATLRTRPGARRPS